MSTPFACSAAAASIVATTPLAVRYREIATAGAALEQLPPVAVPPEIEAALRAGAVVAYGASGGKDAGAMLVATERYLDSIGHPRDRRLVVHADLGLVEWSATPALVEAQAAHVGHELVVVRAATGSMMEQWTARLRRNVARYVGLRCVTLITPWSSAAMRFCTAQAKTDPIFSLLRKRFPGQTIVSVTGIRGDESAKRKQMPVAKPQSELTRPSVGTVGWDWHPIAHYTLDDVCVAHVASGLSLHEAYTTWGASRVSCSACVLAARADLLAALGDARNHAAFREIVALELASTFSFKPNLWVSDLADALLTDEERAAREHAKAVAARRRAAEARLPEHLLYADGWPVAVPSLEEAALLASVRQEVAALLGFDDARCLTPDTVRQQYADLLEEKALREARRRPRRRAADQGAPAAPRTTSRATATQFALLL